MVGRPPRAGVAIPNASPCRVGLAVLMATALAALGHLAGGGTVTTSCALLLSALGASAVTTFGAAWAAYRAHGTSPALAMLALGQLVIEAVLTVPADHLPADPLSGAFVHGLAVIAVGALLMGTARTFRPIVTVARQWLRTSLLVVSRPCTQHRAQLPHGYRLPGGGLLEGDGPSGPRGPPRLVALPRR